MGGHGEGQAGVAYRDEADGDMQPRLALPRDGLRRRPSVASPSCVLRGLRDLRGPDRCFANPTINSTRILGRLGLRATEKSRFRTPGQLTARAGTFSPYE